MMKIELTKQGMGSKFYTNDGTEITDLGAVSITIHASVQGPTEAVIDLNMVEVTTHTDIHPRYCVGNHTGVKGLVLENGKIVYLPEKSE